MLAGPSDLLEALSFRDGSVVLPSVYGVSDFAAATIGLASLAVAEWEVLRREETLGQVGEIGAVEIDRDHASVAFRSERYLARPAKAWPSLWDSMAGDYPTRDGFIRLHTNYPHHRAAAERVLGPGEDRTRIDQVIARLDAAELEREIVAEGGCAAAMHSAAEWAEHPHGRIISSAPPLTLARSARQAESRPHRPLPPAPAGRPLAGIRILDLTRVIAGPTCTRFLAAWGAEVLRIDPLGFDEGEALLADTTVGKRCAGLDLKQDEGQKRFEALIAEADALVVGYRSDALDALGLTTEVLRKANPRLVIAALDAYGFEGPWRARRGFDSLVQMSCGIAARGQAVYGTTMPKPLPAQALDHGTGYLLAAAVCRGLTETRRNDKIVDARLSLAGTAQALMAMGEIGDPERPEPSDAEVEPFLVREEGHFGQIQRIACPGRIAGVPPKWTRPAGPLGLDSPDWAYTLG
ncbi:MAG: CoA transferase [Myxococcota bacterium]